MFRDKKFGELKSPDFFNYPRKKYLSLRPFSQILLLLKRKKADFPYFTLTWGFIFEKRATNLIRMRRIALSTLRSAFGF